MDRAARGYSRRCALRVVGGATLGVLAGCTGGSGASGDGESGNEGGSGDGETDAPGTPIGEQLPAPVKGDADADVTLAVFEDYACPHCADYNVEGFPELAAEYVDPGEIRYEHRDLPIPVADPGSFQAANAARAVQDRHGDEAFWEYAAVLFERSGEIPGGAPDIFGTIADEQGHDGEAIRAAAADRVYEGTVQADREEGVELGVEATPSFVLDGEVVASGYGSGTVEEVSAAIEAALSETG